MWRLVACSLVGCIFGWYQAAPSQLGEVLLQLTDVWGVGGGVWGVAWRFGGVGYADDHVVEPFPWFVSIVYNSSLFPLSINPSWRQLTLRPDPPPYYFSERSAQPIGV